MTTTTISSGYVSFSSTISITDASFTVVYSRYYNTPTLTNAGTLAGTGHNFGVSISGGGTVSNSGTISGFYGLGLRHGSVSNSGSIIASSIGVRLVGESTLSNTGTITGQTKTGIDLQGGGSITNADAAALIYGGRYGVRLESGGTLTNSGTIAAGYYGVGNRGVIINNAGGTITGANYGVVLQAGATLTNAGTIVGGNLSVLFDGVGQLVIEPGARFLKPAGVQGNVSGGGASTLELANNGSAGTLGDLGFAHYNGFSQVIVDAGATWTIGENGAAVPITLGDGALTLTGDVSPGTSFAFDSTGAGETLTLSVVSGSSLDNAIAGFSLHDKLVLPGVAFAGGDTASFDGAHTLSVLAGGSPVFTFSNFTPVSGVTSAGFTVGADFVQEVACFRAGTRIATADGLVAVERLAAGDLVRTAEGLRPVRWMGHRRIDCRRHKRPQDVWPMRVQAHAFGPDAPCRDLFLSPDHAVLVDGVLIPVRYLANGASILQVPQDAVTYWHVELDRHDVVLAEGLACESYLDTGNRAAFANGGAAVQMHADFGLAVWRRAACARLVVDGAELEAARSLVLERALGLGHAMTRDADLRLMVGGEAVRPEICGGRHRFRLPAGAGELCLVSRSAVAAEMVAERADHRRLGVAVSRIVHDGEVIALDDGRLGDGWHDREGEGTGAAWRWTDGAAVLAVPGGGVLDIEVAITGRYWLVADAAVPVGAARAGQG